MYEDIVRRLRKMVKAHKEIFGGSTEESVAVEQAADAIEKLSRRAAEWEVIAESWQKACKGLESRIPRWIPVAERLPEEYVDVLCYCSRTGQYGCGEWCKKDNGSIYWFELNAMIPTHWMPLPEPPKEE